MRSISELDLVVIIPLLVQERTRLQNEVQMFEARAEHLTDDEVDMKCDLQEQEVRVARTFGRLKNEYLAALADRVVLPPFEQLVEPNQSIRNVSPA